MELIGDCRTLLAGLEELSPHQGLATIDSFLASHPSLCARRSDPVWPLLQEIHFQHGQLALAAGDPVRCVQALSSCEWRDAAEVETRAVRATLVATEFGPNPLVIKLGIHGYHIFTRMSGGDERVLVGRLDSDLRSLLVKWLPKTAHDEMVELRDLLIGFKRAQIMAKSCFLLHSNGYSELALGLLELSLSEGLEHPALAPSRDALANKGVLPDPDAATLLESYGLKEQWGHGVPRVSYETAREELDQQVRMSLAKRSSLSETGREGQWVLRASDEELVSVLNGLVIRFLAEHQPERVRAVLALSQSQPDVRIAEAYLALGQTAEALEFFERMPILVRWSALTNLSQGRPVPGGTVKPSNSADFASAARESTRVALEDPSTPCALKSRMVEWLLRHEPAAGDWLALHGLTLPLTAQLLAAPDYPALAEGWTRQALERGDAAGAARLWTEIALSEGRESLEEQIRPLLPTLLAKGAESYGVTSGLLLAAGSWLDYQRLSELLSEGENSHLLGAVLSLPQSREWARTLSESSRVQDRQTALHLLVSQPEEIRVMMERETDPDLLSRLEGALAQKSEPPDPPSPGLAALLRPLARPCLGLNVWRGRRVEARSRVGGCPDLAKEATWPEGLSFLLQLDLAEVAAYPAWEGLPSHGLLSLFVSEPWFNEAVVLHTTCEVQRRERPPTVKVYPEGEMRFQPGCNYPRPEVVSSRLEDEQFQEYVDGHPDWGWTDGHRLLGWSQPVQGTVIENEADDKTAACVLLELDTDAELGWIWGDVGKLHFTIPRADLQAGRFDRVEVHLSSL